MATRRGGGGRAGQTQVQEPKRTTKVQAPKEAEGHPHTSRLNQAVILGALAAPWILLLTYPLSGLSPLLRNSPFTFAEIVQQLYESLQLKRAWHHVANLSFLELSGFWYLAAALSVPHVYYFLIWTNSKSYYSFCSKYLSFIGEPYQVLAYSAHAIKLFQLCALLIWFCGEDWLRKTSASEFFNTTSDYLTNQHLFQLLLGSELFIIGQVFNSAVYQTIGETGVYYGCRLGKHIPWVYGFPFNTAPHPQYFGATLSVWGTCFLFASTSSVDQGLYAIALTLSLYYCFSSFVEQFL